MKKTLLTALFLAPFLSFAQFRTNPSVLDKKTVTFTDTTKTLKKTAQPLNWPIAKTVRVSGSLMAGGAALMAIGRLVANQPTTTESEFKRAKDINTYSFVAGSALIVIGGLLMSSQK